MDPITRLIKDPLLKISVARVIESNLEDRHKVGAILDIIERQIEIALQLNRPTLADLEVPK